MSAVNSVNCTINKGEVFAIVGESGCGKSTVAHSIMKLLPGSNAEVTGKIIFKGKNLLEMNEEKIESVRGKEIGMIFQNPLDSLNPVYTVGGQIAEAIALDHVDRVEAVSYTHLKITLTRMKSPIIKFIFFQHSCKVSFHF